MRRDTPTIEEMEHVLADLIAAEEPYTPRERKPRRTVQRRPHKDKVRAKQTIKKLREAIKEKTKVAKKRAREKARLAREKRRAKERLAARLARVMAKERTKIEAAKQAQKPREKAPLLDGEPSFLCRGPCGQRYATIDKSRGQSWCRACDSARRRAAHNPQAQRTARLKRVYGMTPEDFNNMLNKQNGECPICGCALVQAAQARGLRKGEAVVDHDHNTGAVRALLCGPCNTAIGALHDDPNLAMRAYNYLMAAFAEGRKSQ